MATHSSPIGLLAGSGRFPVVVAEKARRLGLPVVCVGIRSEATPELSHLVDEFHWARLGGLGRMIRCFKRAGCQRVVMAGKITKAVIHGPWRWINLWPDPRTLRFWFRRWRVDNRDDSLLLGVVKEFALDGLTCESALDICPELLVGEGILTARPPTDRERQDMAHGWQLAKAMGGLDVGQSVAVKDGAAVAIEAIEGTDQAIRRAGEFCAGGGFVVVKVAKPQQDMRFDVPTVGCSTIENIYKAGGRALAIEADKTIVIDQPEAIALANRYGIAIEAIRREAVVPSWDDAPVPLEFGETLGPRPLTLREQHDVEFAWHMASKMRPLGVGRTVIVREKSVIVVEANEGSIAAIRRARQVCRGGGFVVLRMTDANDSAIDGPYLQELHRAGGRVLAIENNGTNLPPLPLGEGGRGGGVNAAPQAYVYPAPQPPPPTGEGEKEGRDRFSHDLSQLAHRHKITILTARQAVRLP
jgi:DUF1009 family protein